MAQSLRADKVVETLEQLHARISERFPGSGLSEVCAELVGAAKQTMRRARRLGRPILSLRLAVGAVVIAAIGAQLYAIRLLGLDDIPLSQSAPQLLQSIESAANLIILAGISIFFLFSLERRAKGYVARRHLHELRSFAHVVDMHQLTKDPVSITQNVPRTASSPTRNMSEYELARYLDYCGEMLDLTGKLAALYGEQSDDSAILDEVNDIESLTTNLGRKIWQKIMIIDSGRIAQS